MRWTGPALGSGVFAAALIGSLIVLAPATLIDPLLERASGGRLRLAEAQGSLWSGSGWIEIRDVEGRAGVAKRLTWRVLPGSLLRGHLAAEVELDHARPFPVTLSLSRIQIAGAVINLPSAALGLGMPKLAPLRLTGDVLVDIPHLSFERGGRMDGDAKLQWHAAGSALTPISPLGAYEVRMKAAGPEVQVSLSTLEGPLQLDGKGTWPNSGSQGAPPSFLATARVPVQHQEQLAPLLRLFAVERGDGTFELQLK